MIEVRLHIGDGYLVCAEGALDRNAVNLFRSGPSLGSTQDDGWPLWSFGEAVCAGVLLVRADFRIAEV